MLLCGEKGINLIQLEIKLSKETMNFARRFATRYRKKFQTAEPIDLVSGYVLFMGIVPFTTSSIILSYRLGKKQACCKRKWASCQKCKKYVELPSYWPLNGPKIHIHGDDYVDVTINDSVGVNYCSLHLSLCSLSSPYWFVTHVTQKIGTWVGQQER